MKAIDTNVLLRYFAQDDPIQSPLANAFIEEQSALEVQIFVNRIVLCELVWVLSRAYRYKKTAIANVIEKILSTEAFVVENSGAAWLALEDYKKSGVDFSDILISKINKAAGYAKTATFDKKAATLAEFEGL